MPNLKKVRLFFTCNSPSFVKRGLGGDLNDIEFSMSLKSLLPNLPFPSLLKRGIVR